MCSHTRSHLWQCRAFTVSMQPHRRPAVCLVHGGLFLLTEGAVFAKCERSEAAFKSSGERGAVEWFVKVPTPH